MKASREVVGDEAGKKTHWRSWGKNESSRRLVTFFFLGFLTEFGGKQHLYG